MNTAQLQSYVELMGFGFLCALVLSFLLTPVVMKLGTLLGIVDEPNERRIHITTTPRCGGLAVFLAYSVTLYLLSSLINFPQITPETHLWVKTIVPVSFPLIVIGLIDDRWEIKPIFKLLGQILVGLLAWDRGIGLDCLVGVSMLPAWDAFFTIFLYVAAMNAYNLIDGMDGVAGGLAAITSIGLGCLNLIIGNEGMAVMCFALTGACLGFLRFNFHPARVFLGDTGSMYIGYILMSLTLVAQSRTTAAVMLIIPLLTMGVPLIDTGLAIWRRSVRKAMNPGSGKGVSNADKDHLHHRLARKGLTQKRVAITLYVIQAVLFSVGLLLVFMQNFRFAIFTIAFFAGSYVVLRYLASLEMSDSGRWIVDGIRRPGRSQLYNSFLPIADILILTSSLFILSWLLGDIDRSLNAAKLFRETGPLLVGGPLILIWATRHYRLQWTRARALDFFTLGLIVCVGVIVSVNLSSLPLHHDLKEMVLINLILLICTFPLIVCLRAFPRLVQDMMQYHERKKSSPDNDKERRVIIYGAGYGYTLITRAESFDDSSRRNTYCLVGLIDDDPHLRGRLVHGHQVLGSLENLSELIHSTGANEVLVSTNLEEQNQKKLMEIAERLDLRITQRVFTTLALRP
ncbi:MAG: hypothetical protein ACO3N7_03445 [Kiritimatiellia bacterium]